MRIAIITNFLQSNSGGILQNYALQTTLKSLGHEAVTMKHSCHTTRVAYSGSKAILNQLQARKWGLLLRDYHLLPKRCECADVRYGRACERFVKQHIRESRRCSVPPSKADVAAIRADAYIVGSDQVWRDAYYPDKPFFFLNFLPAEIRRRSISYAASFGTDNWQIPQAMKEECARLAAEMKALSVREDSGVRLCEKELHCPALRMPDPTMLLEPEHYRKLYQSEGRPLQGGWLGYYILDKNGEKRLMAEGLSAALGQELRHAKYNATGAACCHVDSNRAYESIEYWLQVIDKAAAMLTDSFHGTVFSILFHTPFLAICNEGRGSSRFATLLRIYGLEDRLILRPEAYSAEELVAKMQAPIDWERIDAIRHSERELGMDFLRSQLA